MFHREGSMTFMRDVHYKSLQMGSNRKKLFGFFLFTFKTVQQLKFYVKASCYLHLLLCHFLGETQFISNEPISSLPTRHGRSSAPPY